MVVVGVSQFLMISSQDVAVEVFKVYAQDRFQQRLVEHNFANTTVLSQDSSTAFLGAEHHVQAGSTAFSGAEHQDHHVLRPGHSSLAVCGAEQHDHEFFTPKTEFNSVS